MDHVVYVDAKAKELGSLLDGSKTMIIRGATGRKLPHGRVFAGDVLYFIENNVDGLVKAKANVLRAHSTEKLTEVDSVDTINGFQKKLKLSDAQFVKLAGKQYLVLIDVTDVEAIEPFAIDKSNYGNMDDWLPVEDIETVKVID